ncbi:MULTISPECIES: glycoside hydrolase family 19 protein [unclassified Caballeronia]|uniref:glycoside hydrolase family 19 protein n=1 Tax=unclassified Caballeronia TaxID=2646786 RepID=UPI00285CA9DB|nr:MULTISPECIES: glycoside hydrolase family 19 protein [unclassified Caballeronia]MDR5753223.1 glycoside hydrolase family 19 protein [Caballeronia sp. LZ024]MDR5840962.1 glycoside hydrolase family 19 protein [Caballeronia sp. LZ031]
MDQSTFMAATGASQASAAFWLAPISVAMERYQINTPARQAAFLAQIAYESGGFPLPPVAEKFNYAASRLDAVFSSLTQTQCNALGRQTGETCVPPDRQQQIANLVYQNKCGNGPAASGDGWRYRGSGLIQLTFKGNFDAAGKAIGVDLVANPDSVRNDAGIAALVAAWFWQSHGCNELADQGSFHAITAKINPAHEGEQGRDNAFELASNALGAAVSGGNAMA